MKVVLCIDCKQEIEVAPNSTAALCTKCKGRRISEGIRQRKRGKVNGHNQDPSPNTPG